MPLSKGSSKQAIKHNIETETAAGRPHAQAVAIALNTAYGSAKKKKKKKKKGDDSD